MPSIERLLESETSQRMADGMGRNRVRDLLREITDGLRKDIITGKWNLLVSDKSELDDATCLTQEIERRLIHRALIVARPSLRRVINATGVIIHTNLGRAPLARAAVEAVSQITSHYSNIEYDIDRGERGKRESHCQDLISRLTGSEASIVANNNAAAVLLVLNTLAEGGEVIVSRGELVEIGGSFRIPEVMEKSGARLREVGTTNRTRIGDYKNAINENTRLILRVHPSNYRVVGFTERPTPSEIAGLARQEGIPSFEDLGSGCLIDVAGYGVRDEPVVAESLKAGMSLVSFSGDKMLGGPQAGIIAGARAMIELVRKNPLMRALRVDKSTYAALEATLSLYEQERAETEVPVIRAMAMTLDSLKARATRFKEQILTFNEGAIETHIEEGESVIGAGSAPQITLPTALVTIRSQSLSASSLHEKLRNHKIPIITRTERDRILIDMRTVEEDEEVLILDALSSICCSVRANDNPTSSDGCQESGKNLAEIPII
jgi:L-seryl-tRNA(Ser) seleniumtransferase